MTNINKLVVEEITQLKLTKGGSGDSSKQFVISKENSKDKTPLPKEKKEEIKDVKPEGDFRETNPNFGEKASNILQKRLQHGLSGL